MIKSTSASGCQGVLSGETRTDKARKDEREEPLHDCIYSFRNQIYVDIYYSSLNNGPLIATTYNVKRSVTQHAQHNSRIAIFLASLVRKTRSDVHWQKLRVEECKGHLRKALQ